MDTLHVRATVPPKEIKIYGTVAHPGKLPIIVARQESWTFMTTRTIRTSS